MLRFINGLILTLFCSLFSKGQELSFLPEIMVGKQSTAYHHFIKHKVDSSWSINNVSFFDTQHTNDKNNIFLVRNMLSYNLYKHFNLNLALGVKNPGAFATLGFQYQYSRTNFQFSYSCGSTYQNGFTLEQTLFVNYTPTLSEIFQAYLNIIIVVNTDLQLIDRGIQQFRLGIKRQGFITGIATNLDQFRKSENTRENFGIFIKHNF